MKKLTKILFFLLLAVAFVGCDKVPGNKEFTTYDEEYKLDKEVALAQTYDAKATEDLVNELETTPTDFVTNCGSVRLTVEVPEVIEEGIDAKNIKGVIDVKYDFSKFTLPELNGQLDETAIAELKKMDLSKIELVAECSLIFGTIKVDASKAAGAASALTRTTGATYSLKNIDETNMTISVKVYIHESKLYVELKDKEVVKFYIDLTKLVENADTLVSAGMMIDMMVATMMSNSSSLQIGKAAPVISNPTTGNNAKEEKDDLLESVKSCGVDAFGNVVVNLKDDTMTGRVVLNKEKKEMYVTINGKFDDMNVVTTAEVTNGTFNYTFPTFKGFDEFDLVGTVLGFIRSLMPVF